MRFIRTVSLALSLFFVTSAVADGDDKKELPKPKVDAKENIEWRKWAQDIAKKTDAIQKKTLKEQGAEMSEWLMPKDEDLAQFEKANEKVFKQTVNDFATSQGLEDFAENCVGSRCDEVVGDMLRIFVSFSMPEHEIISLFQEADTYEGDMSFHIRGVDPITKTIDGTIDRAVKIWQKAKVENRYHFTFAPDLFKELEIDSVPMMVIETGAGKIVKMKGISDFEYFVGKAKEEATEQDLPQIGAQYDIAEKDFMEDVRDRLMKLDTEENMEKLRKKARDYFKERDFPSLPYAVEDRYWKHDPSLRIVQDMYLPNGKLIHKAGDVINPMAQLPYSQSIIVADLTNPKQYKYVKETLMPLADTAVVTVMTTKFDGEGGWRWLAEKEDDLGVPIYSLDVRLIDAFNLEAVPTFAKSAELHFDVWEFGEETWNKDESEDE